MPNSNPLLVFSNPVKEKRTALRPSFFKSLLHTPFATKQDSRLGPKFDILRRALETKSLLPQTSTLGLEPECTVVMEIIGSLENFISITRNVEGLEWLAEFDNEEIEPDDDFYLVDKDTKIKTDKKMKSKLFVTMASQRAIDELLSLWNVYKNDQNAKLGKGKSQLKEVFKCLYDLRRWNVTDRLEDTFLIENWQFRIDNNEPNLPVEIELWYRDSFDKRQDADRSVKSLINNLSGSIVATSIIDEIRYHSILATIPSSQFDNFKDNLENVELLKSDEVMFIKSVPQSIGDDLYNEHLDDFIEEKEPLKPLDECVLAVLDGVPAANHPSIKDYIIVNDEDDLSSGYTVENMKHGTAICSLIVNGDLDGNEEKLIRKIYVRPILSSNNAVEQIPNSFLPVDLTYRAIIEIFEQNPELSKTVKIINLSIGDTDRQFNKTMSAWARLIDFLSWKYKILFCISAGNYGDRISIDKTLAEWKNLSDTEKNNETLSAMLNRDVHRKILAPAESINSITVGAIHSDCSETSSVCPNQIELLKSKSLPSTITRFGLGLKNSIKPDICVEGGRQLYQEPILENNIMNDIELSKMLTRGPGICVAAQNDKKRYYKGTSFACALTSRNAVKIYDILEKLHINDTNNIAVLIKTLLVHGATWNDCEDIIKSMFPTYSWQQYKRLVTKMIGYGKPNFEKVLGCTNQQATAIAINNLADQEGHIYEFPMPPTLSGKSVWMKLTISLGWFSPLNFKSVKYKRAKLWVDIDTDEKFKQMLDGNKKDVDYDRSKKGTIQHQIYEGEQALAFVEGDVIKIKINCSSDDGRVLGTVIPYGLAVSLEVKEGIDIPIYQEVKERIQIKPRVQTRA